MSEIFDADKYWATRTVKVFVVRLTSTKGTPETKYIRAKTSAGAIRTAKYFSPLRGRVFETARLATP